MKIKNIYEKSSPLKDKEIFELLKEYKNVKIIKILSPTSLDEQEFLQEEAEWVVLLKGEVLMEIDGKKLLLQDGDSLFIDQKVPHKILKIKKEALWLAIHIF